MPVSAMTSSFLEFERLEHCPGCGSSAIEVAIEPDIGQCSTCQLYFRNPRPTQAEIARSYDTGLTFEAWQAEEPARAGMWERRLAIVRKFVPGGRLLDVGTGDGRFLEAAQKAGFEVAGTEVSATGVSYARQRGFDVYLGQITDLELPTVNFDVVTMWHVLEHVPEPAAVLRKLYALLRPGGILAVAVPNEENFFVRKRFGKTKANPFAPLIFGGEIHLTYFRPATLCRTLRTAGFNLVTFGVDDAYYTRDTKVRVKLAFQQSLARLARWHFAVAMYAVCRRPKT